MQPQSYARDAVNLLGAGCLIAVAPTAYEVWPKAPAIVAVLGGLSLVAGCVVAIAVLLGVFCRLFDATSKPTACMYCKHWSERVEEAEADVYRMSMNVGSIARVVGARQAEEILESTLTDEQRKRLKLLSEADAERDERVKKAFEIVDATS